MTARGIASIERDAYAIAAAAAFRYRAREREVQKMAFRSYTGAGRKLN